MEWSGVRNSEIEWEGVKQSVRSSAMEWEGMEEIGKEHVRMKRIKNE